MDPVKAYKALLRRLKKANPRDQAMQLAVGGNFDATGALERDLLIRHGLKKTDYLIDVGCGSGRLAKPLSEFLTGKYLGIDVIPDLVNYARAQVARSDWKFEVTDGFCIPEEDGKADMVCFFSIFTHLLHEYSYVYLGEAKRVLKPGGKIIFSFLDFAVPSHWGVFRSNVEGIGRSGHLNMFISRDAITVWAKRLNLRIEVIVNGDEPHVPQSHPASPPNGDSTRQDSRFGQSVCVLRKQ